MPDKRRSLVFPLVDFQHVFGVGAGNRGQFRRCRQSARDADHTFCGMVHLGNVALGGTVKGSECGVRDECWKRRVRAPLLYPVVFGPGLYGVSKHRFTWRFNWRCAFAPVVQRRGTRTLFALSCPQDSDEPVFHGPSLPSKRRIVKRHERQAWKQRLVRVNWR